MTLLYEDGRQGEINLIASQDNIIHLGNIDFENLTVNLKPKTVAAGEKAPSLGETTAPFGDLYLQGNTLTISTRSIGITEQSGTEYLDFGSNVVIGSTVISGTRLLAFQDQLKTTGLTDVTITGIEDGNVLEWNQDTSKWIHADFSLDPADLDLSQKNIAELNDVEPNTYTEGMMWQYSPSADAWASFNPNDLDLDYPKAKTFSVNSGTSAENPTGTVRYSASRTIQILAGQVVVDTFDINIYRTAKYIVTCEDYTTDNKAYWTGQAMLVHDGTNTGLSLYGDVEIGIISMMPIIESDITGSNVRLKVTTSSDQQVVTVHRTVFDNYL
tara:strand:- start:9588 stop:10571 length:984 start_codon:yes stop_codon:yes gene_type:complete